jgi:hypothetical protein
MLAGLLPDIILRRLFGGGLILLGLREVLTAARK